MTKTIADAFRILLLVLALLQAGLLYGQQRTLVLQPGQEVVNPALHADYLLDTAGVFSEASLETPQMLERFRPVEKEKINFGFFGHPVWFRFTVGSQHPANDWLLVVAYPNIDLVELFEQDSAGRWSSRITGERFPVADRAFFHRNYLFALDLPPNAPPKTFYLKVHTEGSAQVPITLARRAGYFIDELNFEVAYGILIGIMFIMVFYNLFVFFSLRDINYLLYVFPIISYAFFSLTVSGHVNLYILPDNYWLMSKMPVIAIGAWTLSANIFSASFLNSKHYTPWFNVALKVFMLIGAVIVIAPFVVGYNSALRLASSMVILNALLLVSTGIAAWARGNQAARFFVIAWFAYLLGTVLYGLRAYVIVPDNMFTQNALAFGSVLEVVLLSLALSDKYRIIRQERERTQAEIIRLQQQTNAELERKVAERTAELEQQKDALRQANDEVLEKNTELEQQKEEIAAQRDLVAEQKQDIERKNNNITASINYARRIQKAMMVVDAPTVALLPEHFVYFKPKDIVSGDFYRFLRLGDDLLMVAADCTGHGVPGAFMSLIGVNLLRQVVHERHATSPDQILAGMDAELCDLLLKEGEGANDGMDMGIVRLRPKEGLIEFAGAHNGLILFSGQEAQVVKGDRMAIGGTRKGRGDRAFTLHTVPLESIREFYLFSDGVVDQFGGPARRKLSPAGLVDWLGQIRQEPMAAQRQHVKTRMAAWMQEGQEQQIDDMLLIGVRP